MRAAIASDVEVAGILVLIGTALFTVFLLTFMIGNPVIPKTEVANHTAVGDEVANVSVTALNIAAYEKSPRITLPLDQGRDFCIVAETPRRGLPEAKVAYEYDWIETKTVTDRFGSYETSERKHFEAGIGSTGDTAAINRWITIPENAVTADIVVYMPVIQNVDDKVKATKVDVIVTRMSPLASTKSRILYVSSLGGLDYGCAEWRRSR